MTEGKLYRLTISKEGYERYERVYVDVSNSENLNASLSTLHVLELTFVPIPGGTFQMGGRKELYMAD